MLLQGRLRRALGTPASALAPALEVLGLLPTLPGALLTPAPTCDSRAALGQTPFGVVTSPVGSVLVPGPGSCSRKLALQCWEQREPDCEVGPRAAGWRCCGVGGRSASL